MSNETNEIEFVNGLSVKPRHEKTPDYVLANGSINCEQIAEFIKGRTGYINWQAKLSKAGKPYVAVDNWKPKEGGQSEAGNRPKQPAQEQGWADDSEIPF